MNAQTQDGQPVQAVPLTNWKNAPTLMNLKRDDLAAKPIHDEHVSNVEGWLDNLNVTGKAAFKSNTGGSQVQPKLIRKQAEWRYAALSEPFLSTSDLFNVKPKTWEDRDAAAQNQLILNQQMNTSIDKVRFIDEYVRTAVDEGTVIVRTGWEFDEEEYEVEVPDVQFVVNAEYAQMHEMLAQMKEESPSQYDTDVPDELKEAHDLSVQEGKPIEPKILGKKTVTKKRTLYNRPTAEVCNFKNVKLDPKCKGDITKAGFVIYRFESSLSVLRKDRKYKNLDAVNPAGASILAEPDSAPDGGDNTFNFEDKARERFWVTEYWGFWDINKTGRVVPIVVAWVGDVIIRMEEAPFPDRQLPFVVEHYLPVRQANYGEPDGALLIDNQKVAGAVTRGMIDIMAKSANGQTGIRRDMLDITNRRKFDKGLDYEFNNNVDPRQGIFMHTYPEIPNSAQFMLNLQNYEAESLTGVKSFSQGVSGQSLGDVAAAVRGALDAASKRELGILRRLSNGIIKIGRKFIAMNSEFLSEEEVVRITNSEFIKVRRDDLAGNFDLELSISTAEEDNNKAEQLAFMFQTIGPNGDPGMVKMILSDIAKLRKMPDLAKKIEAYEPQPDPMQQKIQQLEIAKLEAEIAEIQARTQNFGSSAQLNMAKVGTEEVKAGNLQSDTDQKNLNFVEQETGVTQERAKELHGEQARAQGNLKLLEHTIESGERDKDRKHELLKEYVKGRNKGTK
jgi:hypothetical protein